MAESVGPIHWVARFGQSLVDFLVGDAPGLLVVAVVAVAAAAVAVAGGLSALGVVVLPVLVLVGLALSLKRAARP